MSSQMPVSNSPDMLQERRLVRATCEGAKNSHAALARTIDKHPSFSLENLAKI